MTEGPKDRITELITLTLTAPVLAEGDVLAQATALEISGEETAEIAVELREGIKALLDEIDAGYRPHIQRAHELHKGLCAELRERGATARVALDLINGKIGRYEIARQQAEEQARRAAVEAEARAAAERREAEAREAALVSPAQAEDVRAMPLEHFTDPAALTTAVATPAKTKGVSVTLDYEAELTDLRALVEFALANPALLAVCVGPNLDGLNLLVKQQGAAFAIPGVRRVPKAPTVRSTRRK